MKITGYFIVGGMLLGCFGLVDSVQEDSVPCTEAFWELPRLSEGVYLPMFTIYIVPLTQSEANKKYAFYNWPPL